MATYGTDLIVIATGSDGESGTWNEFNGWASGGSPGAETENFIQNTQSQSQTFGNAVTGKSIAFDAGSDVSGSIPTGDVIMGWVFMGAPTNMYTYASGGHRFGIGTSLTDFDMWYISGDDRPPNPYGGWWNIAVDPRHATDATGGAGSGGAWRWFGSLIGDTALGIRVKIAKGNPHAVDGMLMGRGEIYCTGTGATFTLMAAQNDLVANRWGLLQDTGGGSFLWKGLMSLGQSGTSTTFSDSNKSIKIDDTAKTYLAFNKIEIRNASSDITLTNVSILASGTASPGQFEMVENATVAMTGCAFNNMDIFTFQSNATVTGCIWNGCNQITHGGAIFDACSFAGYEGTADTAYLLYAIASDPDGELDACFFIKGTASTHAIEFDATNTPTTITLRGVDFSGYNSANGNTDSALYFPSTSKSYTVNLVGCTGNISYKVGVGGSVSLIADPVTTSVTVKDASGGALITDARILVWVTSAIAGFPYLDSITITGSGTTATVTHTAHGLANGDKIIISGANEDEYNGAYSITVTGNDTYTYNTGETVTATPATGTITATFAFISGVTTGTGILTDTRVVSTNQPISGWVRKGTSSPYYTQGIISGTVDNSTGFSTTVQLVKDE